MVESKGRVLADNVRWARTRFERSRGLLGAPKLQRGECLIIEGATGLRFGEIVHTFGLRYPIDVVFCDSEGVVRHVVGSLRPRRLTRWVRSARRIIELPAGTVGKLHPGERLLVRP